MDLFLKTEWILNVFGAAGIVMIVTLINRKRTDTLIIRKSFKSFRSTRSSEPSTGGVVANHNSDQCFEACSDDPEALQVKNVNVLLSYIENMTRTSLLRL